MRTLLLTVGAVGVMWVALAPVPVRSDTVATTSGQTFLGQVAEETPERVVIKTESGTVTVPRAAIATVDRGALSQPSAIAAEKIKPEDAPKAFEAAKDAIAGGNWVKAGSLLEGLLALDAKAFASANRGPAASALAACYLALKDAHGAARTFARRADLASAPSDRQRLLATAEALETVGSVAIGPKGAATYEDAIAAAMEWKARQLLGQAKDLAAKATDLNDMAKLEAAARQCLDKLAEADLYVPGFSLAHRKETLIALADNILKAARATTTLCAAERKTVSRYWKTALGDARYAAIWNRQVTGYLRLRQAAEDGIKNLKAFAPRAGVPEVLADRTAECTELLAQLDTLQYHEVLPGKGGIPANMRIVPRKIGSPFPTARTASYQ